MEIISFPFGIGVVFVYIFFSVILAATPVFVYLTHRRLRRVETELQHQTQMLLKLSGR